jgi:hypothetical protein
MLLTVLGFEPLMIFSLPVEYERLFGHVWGYAPTQPPILKIVYFKTVET